MPVGLPWPRPGLPPFLWELPLFPSLRSYSRVTQILPLIHPAQWVTLSQPHKPPASADPHRLSLPTILAWSPHAKKMILALTFCQHIPARGWVSVPYKRLPHTEMKSLFNPLPWVLLSAASGSCRFCLPYWIAFFDALRNSVQSSECVSGHYPTRCFLALSKWHWTEHWPTGSCFWKDLRSLQFHSVLR